MHACAPRAIVLTQVCRESQGAARKGVPVPLGVDAQPDTLEPVSAHVADSVSRGSSTRGTYLRRCPESCLGCQAVSPVTGSHGALETRGASTA